MPRPPTFLAGPALARLMAAGALATAAPSMAGATAPGAAPVAWGQAVEGHGILRAAESAVRERFAGQPGRLTMAPLRRPDGVRVPGGALSLTPRLVAVNARSATVRVVVRVQVDGRPVRDIPVTFDAALMVPGAVALRDLPAGTVLTAADVGEGEVNALAAPALPAAMLSGTRLRHRVAKARALTAQEVEAVPDVARGGRVEVELAQGDVLLQASGVALSDAGVGQRTRVRLWHDQTVTATVTGARRVRLAEGGLP